MGGRSTLFDDGAASRPTPRLDPSGKVGGSAFGLTPNRLIGVCRLALALLLPIAIILGPAGLSSVELRFAAAYGVGILTMLSFRRFGTRDIAGALALLFGARWAFSALTDGTIAMLLAQLAGIGCALAPVHARNVGRLAGPTEGHISFTERRAMWRDRSSGGGRAASSVPPSRSPVPPDPVVALLEYRSDQDG